MKSLKNNSWELGLKAESEKKEMYLIPLSGEGELLFEAQTENEFTSGDSVPLHVMPVYSH